MRRKSKHRYYLRPPTACYLGSKRYSCYLGSQRTGEPGVQHVRLGDETARPATLRFLAVQALGAVTLLLLGVVGFVPAVRVTVQDSRIVLHQGRRSCAVSLDQIRSYVIVAADRYHREYRPYEAIDAYISRMPSEIIMLDTAQAQIAIGLRSTDRLSLAAWMDTDAAECRRMPVRASVDR